MQLNAIIRSTSTPAQQPAPANTQTLHAAPFKMLALAPAAAAAKREPSFADEEAPRRINSAMAAYSLAAAAEVYKEAFELMAPAGAGGAPPLFSRRSWRHAAVLRPRPGPTLSAATPCQSPLTHAAAASTPSPRHTPTPPPIHSRSLAGRRARHQVRRDL